MKSQSFSEKLFIDYNYSAEKVNKNNIADTRIQNEKNSLLIVPAQIIENSLHLSTDTKKS